MQNLTAKGFRLAQKSCFNRKYFVLPYRLFDSAAICTCWIKCVGFVRRLSDFLIEDSEGSTQLISKLTIGQNTGSFYPSPFLTTHPPSPKKTLRVSSFILQNFASLQFKMRDTCILLKILRTRPHLWIWNCPGNNIPAGRVSSIFPPVAWNVQAWLGLCRFVIGIKLMWDVLVGFDCTVQLCIETLRYWEQPISETEANKNRGRMKMSLGSTNKKSQSPKGKHEQWRNMLRNCEIGVWN